MDSLMIATSIYLMGDSYCHLLFKFWVTRNPWIHLRLAVFQASSQFLQRKRNDLGFLTDFVIILLIVVGKEAQTSAAMQLSNTTEVCTIAVEQMSGM